MVIFKCMDKDVLNFGIIPSESGVMTALFRPIEEFKRYVADHKDAKIYKVKQGYDHFSIPANINGKDVKLQFSLVSGQTKKFIFLDENATEEEN